MSCKQKGTTGFSLLKPSGCFFAFLLCCSVRCDDDPAASTGMRSIKSEEDDQRGRWRAVKPVFLDSNQQTSLHEPLPESTAAPGGPLPDFSLPKLKATFSWTIGNVSTQPRPLAPDSEDGYQRDFTGSNGIKGEVLGPLSDSSPHFSEWENMKPFIECSDNVMTFTASGGGFTELLVDREGASPISVFQLPSYCGYSLKSSWSDLEMMVPYDACYIIQENGSYILPLLWWGSPLKVSCPMPMSTLTPPLPLSLPVVFCSPFGMAVQIFGQESDVAELRVLVNGAWGPFVSEQCAYRVNIQAPVLTFFIPYSAPCFTQGDELQLQLLLVEQELILSCPVSPVFTNTPTTPWFPSLFPVLPQVTNIPDPVNLAPSFTPPPPSPPQPPTEEQIAHHPRFPHFAVKYLEQPTVLSPLSPHPLPQQPITDGSPEPQQPQLIYPTEPGEFPHSVDEHKHYLSYFDSPVLLQATSAPDLGPQQDDFPQFPELPVGQSHLPFDLRHGPFFYPPKTPAQISEAHKTTNTDPTLDDLAKLPPGLFYPTYVQAPLYLTPTVASDTKAHAPLDPNSPSPPPPAPKEDIEQLFDSSFYPPASYYPYWSVSSIGQVSESPPVASPPLTPTDTNEPNYQFSQIPFPKSSHSQVPTPPPHPKDGPNKPMASQATCPPHTRAICVQLSHPHNPYIVYPPHYQPLPQYPNIYPLHYQPLPQHPNIYPLHYQPLPQHPNIYPLHYQPLPQHPNIYPNVPTGLPTTSSVVDQFTSRIKTPTWPPPYIHNVNCMTGRMTAFLPFAHPDSIQVRDYRKTWVFLSAVSPLCGYMLQLAEGFGVILHSPLPACHSEVQTPTTISLPIRLWDLSAAQYRTVDLKCLYQSTPDPWPVTPALFQTPQSPAISQPVVPKTQLQCSPHAMIVELPSGSVSEIVVKDIKGNQMKLQEAPKHCGYSASQTSDGKISLSLQLHSRCHMAVQGQMYIINIIYMTAVGLKESKFSCPAVVPGPGQECNLPREQRLPCGSSSVSQPQCISMGCCFNKHPPACYYPMDECTIDRHFVFSVPASLTEPPLSPALLVVAGNSTCKPVKVTSEYALFKIPMNGCGVRKVVIGKTIVYMLEVINKVQTITLNYGTITRDSPVRLLVECRYLPETLLSVSYMVKSPSLGAQIHTQGVFGVQLRIAKDAQYSSYYPQYHQPLQMLLGKPLYLEVRLLNSPDPSLVLLVHFCVAYPRSGKAVWVLLYNGCPNPLDPAAPQAALSDLQPSYPKNQIRRFNITTFQFLPDGKFEDPNEEIYFMCSTEICSPRDGPCVEGCFGR